MSACGAETDPQEELAAEADPVEDEGASEEEVGEEEQAIEVDKDLLSVEVTLPAVMFEEENVDDVISEAKADGVKEVTKNDDGSVTYKMSKSVHGEMMKEAEKAIKEYIEELKTSEDFTSIQDVIVDKSYSEFTMVVDQEAFENSLDGFAAFGLGLHGMYYQLFDGVGPDDYEVTIILENTDTGEVFDTIVYPNALEEME